MRGNSNLLSEYLKTFDFANKRVDEGLRTYLTAFRLPGEAPVIQRLLEAFSEPWHQANGNCFHNKERSVIFSIVKKYQKSGKVKNC